MILYSLVSILIFEFRPSSGTKTAVMLLMTSIIGYGIGLHSGTFSIKLYLWCIWPIKC